jgi:hypothetical protein
LIASELQFLAHPMGQIVASHCPMAAEIRVLSQYCQAIKETDPVATDEMTPFVAREEGCRRQPSRSDPMGPRCWYEGEVQAMHALAGQGWPTKRTARELELSRNTVRSWLNLGAD